MSLQAFQSDTFQNNAFQINVVITDSTVSIASTLTNPINCVMMGNQVDEETRVIDPERERLLRKLIFNE